MVDYRKLKKGDKFTNSRNKIGTLSSIPVYKVDCTSGLFYADVQWEDGSISKELMLCRKDFVWNVRNDPFGVEDK